MRLSGSFPVSYLKVIIPSQSVARLAEQTLHNSLVLRCHSSTTMA